LWLWSKKTSAGLALVAPQHHDVSIPKERWLEKRAQRRTHKKAKPPFRGRLVAARE
jgi:hypothetical protein